MVRGLPALHGGGLGLGEFGGGGGVGVFFDDGLGDGAGLFVALAVEEVFEEKFLFAAVLGFGVGMLASSCTGSPATCACSK